MNGHLWQRTWRPVTIPILALGVSLTAAGWAAAQVSQQLPSAADLTPADFPPRLQTPGLQTPGLQTPGLQTPADYPGSPYEIYDSPQLAPVQCVPPDPAPPAVFSSPTAPAVPPAAAPAPVPPVVAPPRVAPPFVARPYRAAYPPVYEIRRGIVGQPVIRIPGQPLRNFLRFITP